MTVFRGEARLNGDVSIGAPRRGSLVALADEGASRYFDSWWNEAESRSDVLYFEVAAARQPVGMIFSARHRHTAG